MNSEELLQAGRYDEALARLLAGEDGSPAVVRSLIRVRELLRARRYQEALVYLGAAPENFPGFDLARIRAGLEVLLQGESHPELWDDPVLGAEARTLAGIERAKGGQFDLAREQFLLALNSDPGHYRAKVNLANTYAEQGDLERATELYREVIRDAPDYPDAHHNLAAVLRRQGRVGPAVNHLKKAERLRVRHEVSEVPRRRFSWNWLWLGLALLAALAIFN